MATPEDFPEVTEANLKAADARMIERRRSTPHAVAAIYDRRIGRVVVRLNTGLELAFPPHLAEGLANARPADLTRIQISPSGLGLHFPHLDADLYVPALLGGVFGSKNWEANRAKGSFDVARKRPRGAAGRATVRERA